MTVEIVGFSNTITHFTQTDVDSTIYSFYEYTGWSSTWMANKIINTKLEPYERDEIYEDYEGETIQKDAWKDEDLQKYDTCEILNKEPSDVKWYVSLSIGADCAVTGNNKLDDKITITSSDDTVIEPQAYYYEDGKLYMNLAVHQQGFVQIQVQTEHGKSYMRKFAVAGTQNVIGGFNNNNYYNIIGECNDSYTWEGNSVSADTWTEKDMGDFTYKSIVSGVSSSIGYLSLSEPIEGVNDSVTIDDVIKVTSDNTKIVEPQAFGIDGKDIKANFAIKGYGTCNIKFETSCGLSYLVQVTIPK